MTGAASAKLPVLEIRVVRSQRVLTLHHNPSAGERKLLLEADIVSGCDDSATPPGAYKAGKWIKDKTNSVHGPVPWSKDRWANPYGPYFLPLHDAKTDRYTTYGIHGTRGPMAGNFEKPPMPEALARWFMDEETAKYLYCSHGCIRLSNQNIEKLFQLTTQPQFTTVRAGIQVE